MLPYNRIILLTCKAIWRRSLVLRGVVEKGALRAFQFDFLSFASHSTVLC